MPDFAANDGASHRAKRRFAPLVWLASLGAAALLVLGVGGTLSGWTSAIIHNDGNTAGAGGAVALSESTTDGTSCDTSTDSDNEITCEIDKFGGDLTLTPGEDSTATVTFTNTGTDAASSLTLEPGTCTDTAGTLCDNGHLTVSMGCSDGASFDSGSAYSDLVYAGSAPASLGTVSHDAAIAAGAQITCQFTTTLSADAPASDAGASISQPLTWTLSA